jgi:hypothetical protein
VPKERACDGIEVRDRFKTTSMAENRSFSRANTESAGDCAAAVLAHANRANSTKGIVRIAG